MLEILKANLILNNTNLVQRARNRFCTHKILWVVCTNTYSFVTIGYHLIEKLP